LGWPAECVDCNADEHVDPNLPVSQVAEAIARKKAAAVDTAALGSDRILVTADTIVALDGQVLGKPADRDAAVAMLRSLSGRRHEVYTGVCLVWQGRATSFTERTDVVFRPLTEAEIEHYVDTYRPFDKAGAYGIQEWIGMVGISRIEGCYYNVMGFPTARIYTEILRLTSDES
ncbi:MAG: Maf family protein, partial [Bacteroidales bacterium]|nr:Maf family protein [Bacteroidales bacterium]